MAPHPIGEIVLPIVVSLPSIVGNEGDGFGLAMETLTLSDQRRGFLAAWPGS
jgi:hypothetical protein